MSSMVPEHQGAETPPGTSFFDWRGRYPERWDRELADLDAAGLPYRSRTSSIGAPLLEVDISVVQTTAAGPAVESAATGGPDDADAGGAVAQVVTLLVDFGPQYPWFPPRVFDRDRRLELRRHHDPSTGALCLVEEEDWQINTTVAELLAGQLPKLIQAGNASAAPADGIEVAAAEPVEVFLPRLAAPVLLAPEGPIPADVQQGAMVVRYTVRADGGVDGALIEHLLGPGFDLRLDISNTSLRALLRLFTVTGYGRWLRDPAFDPAASAEQTYHRLHDRLLPLEVDTEPPNPSTTQEDSDGRELDPDWFEMLLLVVPSERTHRRIGEGLVALLRSAAPPGEGGGGWYEYVAVQRLGPGVAGTRTPEITGIRTRHVVLVGLGALGGHLAQDIARAGVRRLDLVDGDRVDVATAARQSAPVMLAGRTKASVLGSRLALDLPHVDIRSFTHAVGARLFTPHHDTKQQQNQATEWHHRLGHHRALDQALRTADLVIDATANPAATRYLAALRQAHDKAFLHIAATAGAWGGIVFLVAPGDHACWACLQHHRLEGTLPVPPADPDGLITPAGCTEPTFTGTSADLATIAHHGTRIAIHHLLQTAPHDKSAPTGGLGPGLYVAALRDERGTPCPATWRATTLPIHPDCPLHHHGQTPAHHAVASTPDPASYAVGEHSPCPTTAPTTAERTHPPQPPDEKGHHRNTAAQGTADGTSPAGVRSKEVNRGHEHETDPRTGRR